MVSNETSRLADIWLHSSKSLLVVYTWKGGLFISRILVRCSIEADEMIYEDEHVPLRYETMFLKVIITGTCKTGRAVCPT